MGTLSDLERALTTDVVSTGNDLSKLHNDVNTGASASQTQIDGGNAIIDSGNFYNDLSGYPEGTPVGNGALLGGALMSAQGSLQNATTAYNDIRSFTGSDLQQIDPDAYNTQLSNDRTQLTTNIGYLISDAGIFLTAAGAPELGILLSAVGLVTAYNSSHDPGDLNNLLNQIMQFMNSGGDGPPPAGGGGLGGGAGESAGGSLGDGDAQLSPLVLDLNGSGINLTALSSSSPYFDLTNDGFARKTGWIGSGTGLLCFDPNDANITNITQLFGTNDSTGDGFDALRKLDANQDNVIDSSDPAFASLRVWIDANSNGVTDAGELYTLPQLGIVSINLNATKASQTIAGNSISSISSFTMADGTTHEIADAWFTNSTLDTKPVVPVEVSGSASALPQMGGGGTLRDLRSAMTLDSALLSLVQRFASSRAGASASEVETDVQSILYQWANVADVGPGSRGEMIDARKLEFVEQYLGQPYDGVYDGSAPGFRAASYVNAAWNNLYDAAAARLLLQSPLASQFAPEFSYDAATNTIAGTGSLPQAILAAYQRIGSVTAANLGSWDVLLRVADAARMDLGISTTIYQEAVSALTTDAIGSLAYAIASGFQVQLDPNGRIEEAGTAIDDVFYGGNGIGLIVGNGGGNNFAEQLPSNDIFNYSAGDGLLEIDEEDPDAINPTNTLVFGAGILASQVVVSANANGDVVLQLASGDEITLDQMGHSANNGVQSVKFADGTVWTRAGILQMASHETTGSNFIYGTSGADLLDGEGGDDYIQGNGGGDTIMFNQGYGHLEVNEVDTNSTDTNVLELGAGIAASSLVVRGDEQGDLIVETGSGGDVITVDGEFTSASYGVNQVQLADGSSFNRGQLQQMATIGTGGSDTLRGTSSGDSFDGHGGDDLEVGRGGNDTFAFDGGYGRLEIDEQDFVSAHVNVLELGSQMTESSIHVSASGNDIIITDGTLGDRIRVDGMLQWDYDGVQKIEFADGTVWSAEQVAQMARVITGTAAADTLVGTNGADSIDGEGGDDKAVGGGGNDTFDYSRGYGSLEISELNFSTSDVNVLQLGSDIDPLSSIVTGDGSGNVYISDGTSGDVIKLDSMMTWLGTPSAANGVQEVRFADGTIWTAQQVVQMSHHVIGTLEADNLAGTLGGGDLFDGKGGHDVEVGYGNGDTFVFNRGYGQLDIRVENTHAISDTSPDRVDFGAGIASSDLTVRATPDGSSLAIYDGVSGDEVVISKMLTAGVYASSVGIVHFSDGSTLTANQLVDLETTGTSADDDLYGGSAGGNLFDGKGGYDVETGNGNGDTFVFNRGYGQLTIDETNASYNLDVESGIATNGTNILALGAGITPESLSVRATSDGISLMLTDGVTGDQVTIENMLAVPGEGVQQVVFADGTTLSAGQLIAMETTGTVGADVLYGSTSGGNAFDGKGGDDLEIGNGGDTFTFNVGYGALTIEQTGRSDNANPSMLAFGPGISSNSLSVSIASNGLDLVLTDGIAGDRVVLSNALSSSPTIQELSFSDGATMSLTGLLQQKTTGTAGNDTLFGTSGAECFDGKGGNDTEIGNGGDDTFVFNAGYGALEISEQGNASEPSAQLSLGAGIAESAVTVTATSDGTGLVLKDGISGDRITLDGMLASSDMGVSQVVFADGTTLSTAQLVELETTGTSGSDMLWGSSTGGNLLDGHGGKDIESANSVPNAMDPTSSNGGDTFVFDQGYGQLEINVVDEDYSPSNVLLLGAGLTAESLHVSATADGTSLIVSDGVAGDSITLDNMLVSSSLSVNGIQSIQLADGATMSAQQLVDLETAGTSGNDTLRGVGTGGNVFDGKGGQDLAYGHGGGDTFIYASGYGELEINETDSSWDANNVLQMGAGITEASLHVQAAQNGTDLVITDGVTGDRVTIDAMLSQGVQGTKGIESLQFADGTSLSGTELIDLETTGTAGDDVLYGGATGANVFDGKGGSDLAIGHGNGDTFVFNTGYRNLEIDETDAPQNTANVLELGAGISEASLTVRASADGTSLLVTDGTSGDQIRLDNMLKGHPGSEASSGIEQIQFADGTIWTAAQLEQLETTGTAAAETLYGGATGGSLFDGKGGADTEIGTGSDTFVFNRGYGSLTIDESDPTDRFGAPQSVLELGAGIDASSLNVGVTADGTGVTLTDGVDGDVILIENVLVPPDYARSESAGVQQLQFADGTTMSIAELVDRETAGASGDDTLRGVSSGGNLFDGKGGDDNAIGSGPNNTFVFNEGYGKLSIRVDEVTPEDAATNPDVLLLGPGITVESLGVKATADGTGLVLTDGVSGDQITLENMLIPDPVTGLNGVQQVQFADGFVLAAAQLVVFELNGATQGSDTIAGSYRGSAMLDGRGGDDVAIGNSGSDVFLFNQGYGNLRIEENPDGSGNNSSVLQLGPGISPETLNVSVASDGTSLVIADGTPGDRISIDGMLDSVAGYGLSSGVASVRFADGTTLSRQQLEAMAITLTGTSGSDTIQGTGGSEIFDGKGGNDFAIGNGSSDTFSFGEGYSQLEINEDYYGSAQPVLRFGAGISADKLSVSATADGTGLIISDGTAGDEITLDNMLWKLKWGVTEVAFADGTSLSSEQLIERETTSTVANATLYGSTGSEVFNGSGGNDTEIGNGGSDTFIYHAGYGSLQIVEDYDTNNTDDRPVLELGAGVSESNVIVTKTADGSGIVLTDGAAGDEITLRNMLSRNEWGVTQVSFADGATLSAQQLETMALTQTGTSGSDTIQGTGGSEIFDGKGGGDFIVGNGNSDTFAFNAGYGQLEISEDYYGSAQPVLRFGAGITADNLTVSATPDGTGLVVTDGAAGDRITLDNMLSKVKWGVTEAAFADGTSLSSEQLIEKETTSTAASATLYGSTGAEVLNGSGGNDVEIGNGGSDTFIYQAGYGSVQVVEDYDTNNTNDQPMLKFGSGINEENLVATKTADGSGIVLTDGTAGDQITLQNMLSRNEWGVTQVRFADGAMLSAQQLETMASTLTGTTGSDSIQGTGGSEIFDGKGGNDFVTGNGNSDTFAFNSGYGQLEISEDYYGSAQPVLRFGAGITPDDLNVSATPDGTGLVLTDGTAGDRITLDNMLSKVKWGMTEVAFADGTTLSSEQLIEKETTSTAENSTLYGSTGAEVFNGSGGNDVEIGNGGSDTFVYQAGYGSVQIVEDYDTNNTDDQPVLGLGAGIGESNLIVTKTLDGSSLVLTDGTAGDQITLQNMLSRNEWGVTQVNFADGNTLSAQQLEAMATGVTGTPGDNTYTLQAGDGARMIVNGVSSNDAPSGSLSIQNVNADNVWLQQIGNDLHVDVLGTTAEATIANWFSQPYGELSELTVSGGSAGSEMLANVQVAQLIQAMASFSAGHPGFDPTAPANAVITDSTLLAAVNNAWHA